MGLARLKSRRVGRPPPIPDIVPEVQTPEEVAKLLAAASNSERPTYEKVFLITATTGIQRGELCALRRGDFDWQRGRAVIARGIVKTKDPDTGKQIWVEKPFKEPQTPHRRIRCSFFEYA